MYIQIYLQIIQHIIAIKNSSINPIHQFSTIEKYIQHDTYTLHIHYEGLSKNMLTKIRINLLRCRSIYPRNSIRQRDKMSFTVPNRRNTPASGRELISSLWHVYTPESRKRKSRGHISDDDDDTVQAPSASRQVHIYKSGSLSADPIALI